MFPMKGLNSGLGNRVICKNELKNKVISLSFHFLGFNKFLFIQKLFHSQVLKIGGYFVIEI